MGNSVNISIDNKVLLAQLHKYKHSVSANVIAGIIKTNTKPLVAEMKATAPDRRKKADGTFNNVKRMNIRLGKGYEPGNLVKSIGTKTFTRGNNMSDVSVYVGANKGTRYDGWYAMFQELGTKSTGFGKGITPNPFIKNAANKVVPLIIPELEKDTALYVEKVAQKLGLKTR